MNSRRSQKPILSGRAKAGNDTTREEELINHIQEYLDSGMWKYEACYLDKGDLEVIVKALEEQAHKTHACDWIGRTEAQTEIIRLAGNYEDYKDSHVKVSDVIHLLAELPGVKQDPKTKGWISVDFGTFGTYYKCPWCRELQGSKTSFCPNCGEDMRAVTKTGAKASVPAAGNC